MYFSWNEEKNRQNIKNHGIDFEDAKAIFSGPTQEWVDDRIDYGEERIVAVGYVQGLPITVIYTECGEDWYRLISARQASWREEKRFLRSINKEQTTQRKKRREIE